MLSAPILIKEFENFFRRSWVGGFLGFNLPHSRRGNIPNQRNFNKIIGHRLACKPLPAVSSKKKGMSADSFAYPGAGCFAPAERWLWIYFLQVEEKSWETSFGWPLRDGRQNTELRPSCDIMDRSVCRVAYIHMLPADAAAQSIGRDRCRYRRQRSNGAGVEVKLTEQKRRVSETTTNDKGYTRSQRPAGRGIN